MNAPSSHKATVAAASPAAGDGDRGGSRSAASLRLLPADGGKAGAGLPAPASPLIGREGEVVSVVALLRRDEVRLVTLTGPGGVGKTRLALAAAEAVAADFPAGVRLVELAAIREPGLVLPAIAQATGVQEDAGRSVLATMADALHGRRLLVVLDNLEQVMAVVPDLAALLAACPRLSVLATSRVALRVRAERAVPVAPLGVPNTGASAAAVASSPAVALFVERAQAANPAFVPDAAEIAAVAAICRRLDGLPLAIELAAARTPVLPPGALLARLGRALPVLTGGPRDLPARQQTLRDAIAWGYDLLAPAVQTLLSRLAVFAGGFDEKGAEAVSVGARGSVLSTAEDLRREATQDQSRAPGTQHPEPSEPSLDGLAALVDASLLRRLDGPGGEPRYGLLETVREFAAERLVAAGEAAETRARHAAHFLALAEAAEPELVGTDQSAWLDRLETEHDNLRAALGWALERAPEPASVSAAERAATALRLAGALWRFWASRGYLIEARAWLERALAVPGAEAAPLAARAKVAHRLGNVDLDLGDYGRAQERIEAALALWEATGDQRGVASAHNGLGLAAAFVGDAAAARNHHELALRLRRDIDDRHGLGNSLTNLGNLEHGEGNPARARALLEEALAVRAAMGDTGGVAYGHFNLADLARTEGRAVEARQAFERSLALFREVGDRLGIAYALHSLGRVVAEAGETAPAAALQGEAMALRRDLGDRRGLVECLEAISQLAVGPEPAAAARLLAAADNGRAAIQAVLPTADAVERAKEIAGLRAALGRSAFDAAWEAGSALGLVQAVAEAATLAATLATPPAAATNDDAASGPLASLSPRELEVLALVAQGLTNGEVADRLYLSPRTVHAHLSTIFRKLGVSSRTAAARLAVEHDLV